MNFQFLTIDIGFFYPIVENRSKVSASNVIVDYKFPKTIHFPDEEVERIKNER